MSMITRAIIWLCVCGQRIDIELEGDPIEISDIFTLFPLNGPFTKKNVPRGTNPLSDRFLTEAFSDFDKDFLHQMIPVMEPMGPPAKTHPCQEEITHYCPTSPAPLHCLGMRALSNKLPAPCIREIEETLPFKCAEDIQKYCDANQKIIPCLHEKGGRLAPDCHDAVEVTGQVLSGLKVGRRNATKGKPPSPIFFRKEKSPADYCPKGFTATGTCCTAYWKMNCGQECAMESCDGKGWEWQWRDFRSTPYKCCPPDVNKQWLGGNPICPMGWKHDAKENCCQRYWQWDCQGKCAETQCFGLGEHWNWLPATDFSMPNKCCLGSDRVAHRHVIEISPGASEGDLVEGIGLGLDSGFLGGVRLRQQLRRSVARDPNAKVGEKGGGATNPNGAKEGATMGDVSDEPDSRELWSANHALSVVTIVMIIAFLCIKKLRDSKSRMKKY